MSVAHLCRKSQRSVQGLPYEMRCAAAPAVRQTPPLLRITELTSLQVLLEPWDLISMHFDSDDDDVYSGLWNELLWLVQGRT